MMQRLIAVIPQCGHGGFKSMSFQHHGEIRHRGAGADSSGVRRAACRTTRACGVSLGRLHPAGSVRGVDPAHPLRPAGRGRTPRPGGSVEHSAVSTATHGREPLSGGMLGGEGEATRHGTGCCVGRRCPARMIGKGRISAL